MKLTFLLIAGLCFSVILQAQVAKTLNVTAGGLSTSLTPEEKNTITNLNLTGTIDARDFKTMRDIMPMLAKIDLSGSSIVTYSGTEGTSQYSNDYTAGAIPDFAFVSSGLQGKSSLISIIFSNNLTSIGQIAFTACQNLESLNIPSSVTYIGPSAFSGCEKLDSISIPNSLTYLNYALFSGCKSLTYISIPSSVKSISDACFSNCTSLKTITLPASINKIWHSVFYNCNSLNSIYLKRSSPVDLNTSGNVFYGVNKTICILYVPFGSKADYHSANQWQDFENIIEMPGIVLSDSTANLEVSKGSTTTIKISSNVTWNATSSQTWLKVTPTTGTGNLQTVTFTTMEANSSVTQRTAIVTVSAEGVEPQTISVTQDGKPGETVTDIDGNIYNTVTIGTQVWMVENLKTTKYNDGTSIPTITYSTEFQSFPGYCWYENEIINKIPYGALYNWNSIGTGKLAPKGWHIPSDDEWAILIAFLGGENIAGSKLKEMGTVNWESPNDDATNETGFTALPVGSYVPGSGSFLDFGNSCYLWSSSSYNDIEAWGRVIRNTSIKKYSWIKGNGFSVRCLKDNSPTVTTSVITTITTSTASSGGNVTMDGGATVTARGVCWSTTENPTIDLSTKTSDGTGTGTFTSNITGLTASTTYHVRAYATNSSGTGYGEDLTFTTEEDSVQTGTFTDSRDEHNYKWVKIGNQIWMAENLAYLPAVSPPTHGSNTEPYYYVYGYEGTDVAIAKATPNYDTYGVLYNWPAALTACPSGWHLPSDDEWTALTTYLGGESIAGGKMKETGTDYWSSPNTGATNESGFSALPGGYRYDSGGFKYVGYYGGWWSAAGSSAAEWHRRLSYYRSDVYRYGHYEWEGISVRCVKDDNNSNSTKSINITAGNLSGALTTDEKNTLTKLTLIGTIDARDFKTMRDEMPLLAEIDLSGAKIVAYNGTEGTSIWGNINYEADAVPEFAFRIKVTLISLKLPASLTSISQYAFHGCSNLNSINTPPLVESIGVSSFMNCIGLTSIYIPSSVISIGEGAFRFCQCLITVEKSNPNYASNDGVLFNKDQTSLLYCIISKAGTYNIPLSVTSLGNYAFENCQGLTTIVPPDGITSIGKGAFRNCSFLTSINIPASVTSIQSYAFENAVNLSSIYSNTNSPIDLSSFSNVFYDVNKTACTLFVPYGSKAAYQAANQWKDFLNIIELADPAVQDSLALVALYNATDGDHWTINTNWLTDKPISQWYGITVDENSRVTEIILSNNGLDGTLPAKLGDLANLKALGFQGNGLLTGEIPKELGNLKRLQYLSFTWCKLTGTIPKELGNLTNLIGLAFVGCDLTGTIPSELGNLANLTHLDFQSCQLTGNIPPEFGKLTNLQFLSFEQNKLTGPIPLELGNLTNLRHLRISVNQLTGSIPSELGQLVNLQNLYLDGNQLTGFIPVELGQLTNLQGLYLGGNQLTGTIPSDFGQLANLQHLGLSGNQLTGTIPSNFGQLINLEIIQLQDNRLTGSIPFGISQMTKIQLFSAYNNLLDSLPDITTPANLAEFALQDNRLTFEDLEYNMDLVQAVTNFNYSPQLKIGKSDTITLYYGTAKYTLDVSCGGSQNQYQWFKDGQSVGDSGQDSKLLLENLDYSNAGNYVCKVSNILVPNLTIESEPILLQVTEPQFNMQDYNALVALYNATDGPNWTNHSGWLEPDVPISQWFGITVESGRVTKIELVNNGLKGYLPSQLGDLSNLQYLNFTWCNLTGAIPKELGNLTNLIELILVGCGFTGTIPSELGLLTNLEILHLDRNLLTGSIPSALRNLTNLQSLGLGVNQLTGSIPPELGQLTNLQSLGLGGNQFTGSIPPELGQLTNLRYLDLNSNQLTGGIPAELGQLANLYLLYLYYNPLSGSIPPELGQLSKLGELHLAGNQLSGSIPPELGQLTNLGWLALYGNQLSGTIPHELGQLTNLLGLFLYNNQLSGSIPPELGQLARLGELHLAGNQISGTIPASISQMTSLRLFYVFDNQLDNLPEISAPANLSEFTLQNNKLTFEDLEYNMDLAQTLTNFNYSPQLKIGESDTITLYNGSDYTLNVTCGGTQNSYQWFFNGNPLGSPATVASFLLEDVDLSDAGNYYCRVSNSLVAGLTIESEPIILKIKEQCPVHFHTVWEGTFGTDHMNINVIEAQLNGLALEPGDEIGVFDGELCIGYGKVIQTINQQNIFNIKVSRNDGTGNGYTLGNEVFYKFWDCSAEAEIIVNNVQCFNNQFNPVACVPFQALTTIYVQLSAISDICQTLQLSAGWNIFSVSSNPVSANIVNVFHPMINNNSLVKIQDEVGNSVEDWGIFGGWQNYIGNISPSEGYKIKLGKNDNLEVCGVPVNYPYAISLKNGWNIIGYPQTTAVDGIELVQQLIDRGTLVKVQDEVGNSIEDWGIFGSWQNYIGNFTPGEGYSIKVNADDILWIYENYPKSSVLLPEIIATSHFAPVFSGNGTDHMNINLVGLPVNILQAGDELAIFDGATCVGTVTLMSHHLRNQTASIITSATDNQGMPGFFEGNPFVLKLWNAKSHQEFKLEPEIVKGTSTFIRNETTVASLEKYATTGLDGLFASEQPEINCYPNPFSDEITVEINLFDDTEVHIEVLNQLGQQFKYLAVGEQLNRGVHRLIWDGTNEGESRVAPGIYLIRMKINDTVYYRKVVYSK